MAGWNPTADRLEGKAALVTGSSRGIGYATARILASRGAQVIINGRSKARTAQAVKSLRSEVPGGRVDMIAADVASAQGLEAIRKALRSVDILVCNAAVFQWRGFFELTEADWIDQFQVNVLSGVRLAKAYLPGMIDRGWGRIVLVTSGAAFNMPHWMLHYGVTKAAQAALARGLAELAAGTGVTVNSVVPGPTASGDKEAYLDKYATESGVARKDAERHAIAEIQPTSLIRRFATCDEVANMIAYVCSPLSAATSGASLRVEGGGLRHVG